MTNVRALFDTELGYVVLLFGLFVVPKVLQRWRLPSAITAFAIGAAVGIPTGLFRDDRTLHLLATFGISALFLFAGLEVDFHALRHRLRVLAHHLGIRVAMLALVAWVGAQSFGLEGRAAVLLALALLIPSTGFILDSLGSFGLNDEEAQWVKDKAIATELLALVVLFVALQSTSASRLALALLALGAIIAVLPPLFRLFAVRVVPWAPKSEFAFLLMMAIVMAYATRQLGVYYLVGAFLVGVAARRFREALPAVASERMLHAVEVFASFFAPFYFFVGGAELRAEDLSLRALLIGVAFTVIVLPLRVASVVWQRRLSLRETTADSLRVAVPMLPTLIFTLVIAGILRDRYALPSDLFGALVVYAALNTTIPGLVLRKAPPVFDEPLLPEPEAAAVDAPRT